MNSYRLGMLAVLALAIASAPAVGQDAEEKPKKQKRPKVDSVLVVIPEAKDEAIDRVVAAFTTVGLGVTNQTSNMVEAELGRSTGWLATYDRTTRAIVTAQPTGGSRVLITTFEEQYTKAQRLRESRPEHVKRLDNKAGEDGARIWRQMVNVGRELDPYLDTTDLLPATKQKSRSAN
jgi:hypothetical protein